MIGIDIWLFASEYNPGFVGCLPYNYKMFHYKRISDRPLKATWSRFHWFRGSMCKIIECIKDWRKKWIKYVFNFSREMGVLYICSGPVVLWKLSDLQGLCGTAKGVSQTEKEYWRAYQETCPNLFGSFLPVPALWTNHITLWCLVRWSFSSTTNNSGQAPHGLQEKRFAYNFFCNTLLSKRMGKNCFQ